MKLELFDFIEDTCAYFRKNLGIYEYAETKLSGYFAGLLGTQSIISVRTRIKSESSLKEKLIRNHYYRDFETPEEAIDNLPDLIGITVQCRFIRNEAELYQSLFQFFSPRTRGWYVSNDNPDIYMNLKMPQPQIQRNGFTIYRLDGYYMVNDMKVNYELQIKSMVHNFWSEIEHEVVYKNPDFVVYDRFNRSMLGAIRDNLDVVDRQLEIMYTEISDESRNAQIGLSEKGFKVFVASSVNELVNHKMKESLGFTTDFKKCSAILAQYIYVRDFVNGEHNRERMMDYLEHLSFLSDEKIDFSEKIYLEKPYSSGDPFCDRMGKYFESVLNDDFSWHVFFCVLFTIHSGNNLEDITEFTQVISLLLIQPGWYRTCFVKYGEEHAKYMQDTLKKVLADALCGIGKIDIIHEENLYRVMTLYRKCMAQIEEHYDTYEQYEMNERRVHEYVYHQVQMQFQ